MSLLKFKIINAVIKTIAAGKLNAGNQYVEIEVMEDSMFSEQSHIKTYFVPQTRIPAWQQCIDNKTYPEVYFKYDIVETPPYRAKRGETVFPAVHTTMRLLIRTAPDGSPLEDANAMAEEILNSGTMCIRVTMSNSPVTVNAPAATGSDTNPSKAPESSAPNPLA